MQKHRLVEVEVKALEHLRQSLEDGYGELITPNHASHTDALAIYDLAEGALSLKEIEFYGRSSSGPLSERIGRLIDFILSWLEDRCSIDVPDATVPERVKRLRSRGSRKPPFRLPRLPGCIPSRLKAKVLHHQWKDSRNRLPVRRLECREPRC